MALVREGRGPCNAAWPVPPAPVRGRNYGWLVASICVGLAITAALVEDPTSATTAAMAIAPGPKSLDAPPGRWPPPWLSAGGCAARRVAGPPHFAWVAGMLDKYDIRRTVRKHFADVARCEDPDGIPPLPLTYVCFVIEPSGHVSEAEVLRSRADESVGACLVRAVRSWRFPAAKEATTVTYPFRLCGY